MCLEVGPQVGLVREALLTDGAAVGLLPGVGPHVSLQQPRAGESLATNLAVVTSCVGPHMHRESWHRDINLIKRNSIMIDDIDIIMCTL